MVKIAMATKPKKPTLELTYGQLFQIFRQVMLANAAKHSKGTYNRQDPTAFERIETYVIFDGYDPIKHEQETRYYHVKWNDVTWGVELNVLDCTDAGPEHDIFQTYLDHDSGKLNRDASTPIVETFILGCLEYGEFRKSRPDYEAEEDAAAVLHAIRSNE
jgi:hypothetical protein